MRLLLITGAGASRDLNKQNMPPISLMCDWARALTDHLGAPLSTLLGLEAVGSGQKFEARLGEIAHWLQLKAMNMGFAPMTSGTDDGEDELARAFRRALESASERGRRLEHGLDVTLFEQFGPHRFDTDSAAEAYDSLLLTVCEGEYPEALICATTNYDRSLELALEDLRMTARTGFRYSPVRQAILDADGLGVFEKRPALLYLHGAVGWYRDDAGGILAYPANEPYRPEHGRPAVLYPSPNKSVEDSVVHDIWREFDAALSEATHVLVLGHSLGDAHLVNRLRVSRVPTAITVHTPDDRRKAEAGLGSGRKPRMPPNLHIVEATFGRKPCFDSSALKAWLTTPDQRSTRHPIEERLARKHASDRLSRRSAGS